MTVLINDQPTKLPYDNMTIEQLAEWKKIPNQGTAIAINNKLIRQNMWNSILLHDLDQITIITAAYGG